MTEDEKMQVAVFRFSVIGDFVNGSQMTRAQKRHLLQEKCARKWNWIRLYNAGNGNLKSLYPDSRSDKGKSRSMDEDTCCAIIQLRREMPDATAAHLIAAMTKRRLIPDGIELSLSNVYRLLHQNDLMHLTGHKPVDRRKFEAELPNDLWQSDVMHGPKVEVDGKMRKTYLIAIIDDHSRMITYGRFYLSENLACYLNAFEKALAKRGLPRKLYVDNGAAFRSKHLEYITASLGIHLIHAKPYKPQGKGKIERFFRTVRGQFIVGFKGATLGEINEAFSSWLNTYQQRKHGSTGQTPLSRFTSQMHCLRSAPYNLTDYFRKVAMRKINKDRTITLNGRLFEGPVPLIGKRVELLYHESEPENVEVRYQNKSFGIIRPVNLVVNFRIKRDKNNNPQIHVNDHTKNYRGGNLWSSQRSKNE